MLLSHRSPKAIKRIGNDRKACVAMLAPHALIKVHLMIRDAPELVRSRYGGITAVCQFLKCAHENNTRGVTTRIVYAAVPNGRRLWVRINC